MTSDNARQAVIDLAGRLEPLWREASARITTRPESTPESERWDTAADLLEEAMTALERLSATVDPGLGRRDWTSRRPNLAAVALSVPAARTRPS